MLLLVTLANGTRSKEENDQPRFIHTISQQFHGTRYQLILSDHYQIHVDTMQSSLLLTSSPNTLFSSPLTSLLIPKVSHSFSVTIFSVVSDCPNELSPIEDHSLSLSSSQISISHSASQVSRPQHTILKETVKPNACTKKTKLTFVFSSTQDKVQ